MATSVIVGGASGLGRVIAERLAERGDQVVITSRTDEARPQSISLIEWNLKPSFKNTVFKFTPPKGASRIEIVPVKTK